ncbi:MAG TPA: DUF2127 domain-containing protein, partial [Myxococcales bacterium]
MKAIVAYKFAKAPAMLALAVALTFVPVRSVGLARRLSVELSEMGSLGWRLAHWLEPHLTLGAEHKAAALAWLDGASTLVEGLLLLSGSAWGEWIVVCGLGLLLPVELVALLRHPRAVRALVLLVNAAVVAYLVRLRLHDAARRAHRAA